MISGAAVRQVRECHRSGNAHRGRTVAHDHVTAEYDIRLTTIRIHFCTCMAIGLWRLRTCGTDHRIMMVLRCDKLRRHQQSNQCKREQRAYHVAQIYLPLTGRSIGGITQLTPFAACIARSSASIAPRASSLGICRSNGVKCSWMSILNQPCDRLTAWISNWCLILIDQICSP